MSEEKNQATEVSQTISKDFDKAGISSIITSESFNDLEQLKKYLALKIKELLDTNYEKLISILYRIDVHEDKLNELFGSKNRDYIPERLAELIIERQLQKLKFRNAYKEKNKRISED